jgi:hypothetical protein
LDDNSRRTPAAPADDENRPPRRAPIGAPPCERTHPSEDQTSRVATDLNNHRGVLPVEEGGRDAIRLALQEGGPTGTFTDQDGDTISW